VQVVVAAHQQRLLLLEPLRVRGRAQRRRRLRAEERLGGEHARDGEHRAGAALVERREDGAAEHRLERDLDDLLAHLRDRAVCTRAQHCHQRAASCDNRQLSAASRQPPAPSRHGVFAVM
jgi:hypothetical protein